MVDWSRAHEPARAREITARLDRDRVLWRVVGVSGRVYECVLFRVETGLELRLQAETGDTAPLMTQLVTRTGDVVTIAESWRAAATLKGFRELPLVSEDENSPHA